MNRRSPKVTTELVDRLREKLAYLLALANRRKGVLATFDRGLRSLARDTFDSALEIVPTR